MIGQPPSPICGQVLQHLRIDYRPKNRWMSMATKMPSMTMAHNRFERRQPGLEGIEPERGEEDPAMDGVEADLQSIERLLREHGRLLHARDEIPQVKK